jgi:hypothetical protein
MILSVAAAAQARVEYAGGTVPSLSSGVSGVIEVSDDHYLAFYSRKVSLRVAYGQVNLLEYGQQVDRRLALAVVISPLFLVSKSRKHFLTIGYQEDDGKQQALVFRVDKSGIRSTLASLEARTGQKIRYQDDQARKAGID